VKGVYEKGVITPLQPISLKRQLDDIIKRFLK
jgi:predicted DNA-binding antitoxin AbrB/MazE fold protein